VKKILKLNHIWNISESRPMRDNKIFFMCLFCFCFFIISCRSIHFSRESPLACVIKLHSAEESLSFEIAKKYIDIRKVYGTLDTNNKSAEDIWKEYLSFNYSLGTSKKFINKFLYHKYKIIEKRDKNRSFVEFISLNGKKSITYSLEIVDEKWKVVKIVYN